MTSVEEDHQQVNRIKQGETADQLKGKEAKARCYRCDRLVSKKKMILPFHEQFLTFFEVGLHCLEVGLLGGSLRLNLYFS